MRLKQMLSLLSKLLGAKLLIVGVELLLEFYGVLGMGTAFGLGMYLPMVHSSDGCRRALRDYWEARF